MAAIATSVPKAGPSPFANLAKGKNKAEDDKDPKKDDAKADDDKKDDEKDAKAEDDDEAAAEDDDEKDKKAKKSKKAKSEDGDDDTDKEDNANSALAPVRARERGRILAIMTSEAGLANPDAAARLAVKTSLPRSEVIAMLHAVGPAASAEGSRSDKLRDRMANTDQPKIGAGGDDQKPAANMAQQIVAAGKKRRGES